MLLLLCADALYVSVKELCKILMEINSKRNCELNEKKARLQIYGKEMVTRFSDSFLKS